MQTGPIVSSVAHAGLIGLALFGGSFRSDAPELAVQEVSVISGEEFAALTARPVQPEVSEQPEAPVAPPEEAQSAALAPEEPPEEPREQKPPEPEAPPELPQTAEPDTAVQPVDRVAPVPVPEPEPEARPDEIARPEVAPEEGEAPPASPQEATAPEAATDRIVTEATLAPKASVRPRPRSRPRPQAPAPEPRADTSAAINSALAEALNSPGETSSSDNARSAPSGPPLSSGEREGLRVSVSKYWNVGSLSSDALATTVVVLVRLAPDGTPDIGSIRMLSSSGGSDQAARQAFEAARRAIIRAGSSGFDLPAEKYAHWQEIEMTFNPERMRIK